MSSPAPRPRRTSEDATLTHPGPVRAAPVTATATRLAELVPAPVRVDPDPAVTYTLAADTHIQVAPGAEAVAEHLALVLRRGTGYPVPVTAAPPAVADTPVAASGAGITLLLSGADPRVGSEGYELDITAGGVTLRANTPTGLFYGVQTLRQLLPAAIESTSARPGPWTVPGGHVLDYPRFAYRGVMLDVCRHFFDVSTVKRYLDGLTLYKINYLHLHLTDDQGWRIAIDAWPRLAEVGGACEVDGGPGGFYTKDQYRDIVAYAAARHITIVPEIDVPGHTNAALVAYPALAPDGVAPPPYTGVDVGFSALRVDADLTYDLLADVLGEVAASTPGPYLHIGGDEAWTLSAQDYRTFVERVQPLAAATGKTIMGWHQLAADPHRPDRVLQFWGTAHSEPPVAEAVRQGAKIVMSPGNHTYLDMKYNPQTPLGKDWAGPVEVRQAYEWDPGSYLADVPEEAVLGVEAPLWTETLSTLGHLEYMTFPRLPAVAEVGWSPASAQDWESFRLRLAAQAPRWIAAGITFHPSPDVPWPALPTVVAPRSPEAEEVDAAESGPAGVG